MPNTNKLAKTSDLKPGTGKVVEVAGRSIALFNVGGTFYALDNTCTHRGGPLGEGTLDGDTVTCPWHGAQFDVKNGTVSGPPAGTGVRSYAARIEGDDVVIDID